MFGMGAGELILILVIALLIFGPKKLPELAKGIGKALREFRRASSDLQEQLQVDNEIGAAVREVQAAASGAPSPAELQATRRAYDVPPPGVPATAPAESPALEAIKAAAAARVAAENELAATAPPVETQASKPAIAPAPDLAPAPELDEWPDIKPAPTTAPSAAAPSAPGESKAKG